MAQPKTLRIGFKGIALAPITQNDITGYKSGAAFAIPYAGNASLTPIENSQDFYYDDSFYGQARDHQGMTAELRFASISYEQLEDLGMGAYDAATNAFEWSSEVMNKEYALRYIQNTLSGLPYYNNYRVFQLTGVRADNPATKGSSISACEMIITGVVKKPVMASIPWHKEILLLEDGSNQAACDKLIKDGESFPA